MVHHAKKLTHSNIWQSLKEKAKKGHEKMYGSESGFKVCSGWLHGFQARFGINLLKVCDEKLASDQEEVAAPKMCN